MNWSNSYIRERQQLIAEQLLLCLPATDGRPAQLAEAMRHAVLVGGKRLRPILCLAAAEAAGGAVQDALMPAVAVELLHCYTLVHDDLPCMDNDLLRRGQPTVHAKYGEAMAVLVGDCLLTLAFETLARTPEKKPGTAARLVLELAAVAGHGGVIGGQVEDIRCSAKPSRDDLEYVFQHKTAALFKGACRLGVIAAAGNQASLDGMSAYGDALGFAFQIVDDLLDARDKSQTDRPELSCLSVMDSAAAAAWARQHTQRAITALEGLPGTTAPLAALAQGLLTRIE